MPKLFIMCGIPFSGRDEYAKLYKGEYEIISRDACREYIFGPHYNLSPLEEKEVERDFSFKLQKAYLCGIDIIHNSTNCSEWMIDKIIAESPIKYDITVKFFDVPLYKAIWHNILKYFWNGRWIPIIVLFRLQRAYNKINRGKYRDLKGITITQSHW